MRKLQRHFHARLNCRLLLGGQSAESVFRSLRLQQKQTLRNGSEPLKPMPVGLDLNWQPLQPRNLVRSMSVDGGGNSMKWVLETRDATRNIFSFGLFTRDYKLDYGHRFHFQDEL